MLAMPLAAAGVGFGMTLLLLGTLWALMCYTALLLLEVYQHVPADTGLGSLAARYLGRYGQWITGFSMMFLMYALTAAYISGAGELIASSVNDWFGSDITPATGAIFFALIGGGVGVPPMYGLAKRLIAQTTMHTGVIGQEVGYPDEYYFSKVFKKVTGMSPKEYEAQCLKQKKL
mgnify:CR=1 FL=1